MWIPTEVKDPTVRHAPTRNHHSIFGAVNPHDGKFVYRESPVFNAATFLEFLEQLLTHRKEGTILTLVLDNSRYHHANLLKPWLLEHSQRIQLLFLPPYSPELNPIERVWKLTRRIAIHNRYFPTLNDLISKIQKTFERWAQPNEQLARLCVIN